MDGRRRPPSSERPNAPAASAASSADDRDRSGGAGEGDRLGWADVGKGVFIVLVVLHHTVSKHYEVVTPDAWDRLVAAWAGVTLALKPLRMPLFFLLSGLFATRAVHRSWGEVLRPRVVRPGYLYALWLAILAVVFTHARELPMNRTRDAGEYLADLLFATTGLWYLYATVVYFVLVRATRSLDARLVVALGALLATTSWVWPIEAYNRGSVLIHFVYFAAGARLPGLVRRLGEWRGTWQVALLVAAYVGLGAVLLASEAPRGAATLLLSLIAVPVGVRAIVAAVAAWPRAEQVTASLGRRTLPIYVLHIPVLALLHHLVGELPPVPTVPVLAPLALAAYPVLAALVVTAACLLVHAAAVRTPLRWLFELPDDGPRRGN
ncbi:acyltransferase family protein [Nocardioides sp. SYSU DS0663]|uniref:acyltransferase family protein n=1 Tax=Nocardioides sp. SYSU DS0663 TaxID=3416445 RepID=UPI003F4BB065